jgi:hypothetical protein
VSLRNAPQVESGRVPRGARYCVPGARQSTIESDERQNKGEIMRSRLRWAVLLLFMVAGCNSDNGVTDPDGNLEQGSMSARIDGSSWSATAAISATYNGGILAAAGSDGVRTIGFAVLASGPGTFTIAATQNINALLSQAGSSVGWHAVGTIGSGTLTLNTLTATGASGTFSFVMSATDGSSSTRTITNGAFNVKF